MKRTILSLLLLGLLLAAQPFAQTPTPAADGFTATFPAAVEASKEITAWGTEAHAYFSAQKNAFTAFVVVDDWSTVGHPPALKAIVDREVKSMDGKLTSTRSFMQQGLYPALAFDFTFGNGGWVSASGFVVQGNKAVYLLEYTRASSDTKGQKAFLDSFAITLNEPN